MNQQKRDKIESDFQEKLEYEMEDLEPEYSKLIDENFWDLV